MKLKSLFLLGAALSMTGAALPAQAQDRGNAARDDVAPLTTNGMLDRKDGMLPQLFQAYWRDVHGPLAARITGMHQYWQHHLADPDSEILPSSVRAAVDTIVSDADQLEGIAETTFASETDRQGLGAVEAAGQLFVDEQNVFRATYLHGSVTGNTRTLVDRIADPTPQGADGYYRVQLLFRAQTGADIATFRAHLSDQVAEPLASDDRAEKVRIHFFEAFDASGWDTPGVDNNRTQEQAFDGQIELAFASRANAVSALRAVEDGLGNADLIAGIHAYPVREVYSLIYDGKPTLVGLRSYPVAAAIEAAGADNQKTLAVLQTLHGAETQQPTQ